MSPFLRMLVIGFVTALPTYVLFYKERPILDRMQVGQFKEELGCYPRFENWKTASGVYSPLFKITPKSNFMTPVVIMDANLDGAPDILLNGDEGERLLLFVNDGQGHFTERGREYGLTLSSPTPATAGAFYDYDQDGLDDLVIAFEPYIVFFKKQKSGQFALDEKQPRLQLGQLVTGLGVADLQGDGENDLVLANYFDLVRDRLAGVRNEKRMFGFLTVNRYNRKGGGRNLIWIRENGQFRDHFEESLAAGTYSQAVGLSDVNADGLPDLFFSNDYYYDQFFTNRGHEKFEDTTERVIPRLQHGLSGMNAEFFDYDRDGLVDLFVSNLFQKNFSHGGNILWKKTKDHFVNEAPYAGVTDCGFAWGGKFADLNNDGQDDLVVVNGMFRMPGSRSPEDSRSLWFLRYEMAQVPVPLKKKFDYVPTDKDELSSYQAKCVFLQRGGKFFNVAAESGIMDRFDRRVLALFDMDNDGRQDLLMRGNGGIELYRNTTDCSSYANEPHNWIGFRFFSREGATVLPGLKVSFSLSDGRKVVREVFPSNGFNVWNDARVHVGLGTAKIVSDVEVTWPGKEKTIKRYKIREASYGKYNSVRQE